MNDIEWFYMLRGAAHAVLMANFALAAAGKAIGCRHGSQAMCWKTLPDLVFLIATAYLTIPCVEIAISIAACGIASLGWMLEKVRRSKICNCHGVLTMPLLPVRNFIRLLTAISALYLVFVQIVGVKADNASTLTQSGLNMGLFACFVLLSIHMSETFLRNKKDASAESGAYAPVAPIVSTAYIGENQHKSAVKMEDLLTAHSRFMLLITADNCNHCHTVLNELGSMATAKILPVPLVVLSNQATTALVDHMALADINESFRRQIGLHAVPTLLIIEHAGDIIHASASRGADAIKASVFDFLVVNSNQSQP